MYAMMKKTGDVLDGRMNPTRDNEDYDRDGSGGYSKDTPLLFISGSCQDAIEAIPLAVRDDVHAGRQEDVLKVATKSDDVCDMVRYGLKSALKGRQTPFPVRAAEKRHEMEAEGRSMTEVAIVLKKMNVRQRTSRRGRFR